MFLYACQSWTLTVKPKRGRFRHWQLTRDAIANSLASQTKITSQNDDEVRKRRTKVARFHEDFLATEKRWKIMWFGHDTRLT